MSSFNNLFRNLNLSKKKVIQVLYLGTERVLTMLEKNLLFNNTNIVRKRINLINYIANYVKKKQFTYKEN